MRRRYKRQRSWMQWAVVFTVHGKDWLYDVRERKADALAAVRDTVDVFRVVRVRVTEVGKPAATRRTK